MKLFVNATQHKLTEEQIKEAKFISDEVVDLRDLNKELFEELKLSPDNLSELSLLSDKFFNWIWEYLSENVDIEKMYLHLPIGSPAFMWTFCKTFYINSPLWLKSKVEFVFSHSDRIVEEREDGIKISKFVFKKFLYL